MISFTPELLHNFNSTTTREWLETNGIGGFACSTVIGLNARRYHALLTAAMRPPSGRVVLLSKMEETVVIGGVRYELSTNQYSGAVHPQGYSDREVDVHGARTKYNRHSVSLLCRRDAADSTGTAAARCVPGLPRVDARKRSSESKCSFVPREARFGAAVSRPSGSLLRT